MVTTFGDERVVLEQHRQLLVDVSARGRPARRSA